MSSVPKLRALALDAGNTKVRMVGLSADTEPLQWGETISLVELGRFSTPSETEADEFVAFLSAIASQHPGLPLVLTSVVPCVNSFVAALWPDLIVVDHHLDLPFELALPHPDSIGPDRLCNMAAAAATGHACVLVVDAGTATTFDLYKAGRFMGGLIAPGMALAAACLGDLAARLSPVSFLACPLDLGEDTASAMQAGAYHVGIGGIETVIEGLRRKYGPFQVILTGGLGRFLLAKDRVLEPDWTMRGAIILAGLDKL